MVSCYIYFSLTPLNNGDTIVWGIGDSEGVQNTDWTDFSDSFAVFFPADLLWCFWLSFILDDCKTRFLISVYAFYENTHYTEKIRNVPFYFFSDFQIARFLKRAFHTVNHLTLPHFWTGASHTPKEGGITLAVILTTFRLKGPYADHILIPQGSTRSSIFFDI